MGDPGHELPHRRHLLALDELHLGRLQIAIGRLQLLVRAAELLGPHPDLILQAPGQLLDGLEALGPVHREGDVVGDGGEQLHVRGPDAARLARCDREDTEHLALHPERHHDHGPKAEGADAGRVNGLVGHLRVVDHKREAGDGDPGRAGSGIVERELHGSEPRLLFDAPRHPVTADDAAARVHDEQIGALVAHAVDQALQRLLVDLLDVQRRADGGGQLAQQGELLDRRLEVAELLLELVVRVQDLLGLQIQHPPRVLAVAARWTSA